MAQATASRLLPRKATGERAARSALHSPLDTWQGWAPRVSRRKKPLDRHGSGGDGSAHRLALSQPIIEGNMSKVIISCAVTGAVHTPSMSPHLPVTPAEIAAQAIEA